MKTELTVKSTSSNLGAACIAKKQRLELALVTVIDKQAKAERDREQAKLERKGRNAAFKANRVA